jgi:hypothetical protein
MFRQAVRRIMHRVSRTVADANAAQRRVAILAGAPDRWVPDPHKTPDTYSEFLARTAGPLLHEPSARRRARGKKVR